MAPQISELIERIRGLEEELELELARKRKELRFELVNRKVRFEHDILLRHKALKTGLLRYLLQAQLRAEAYQRELEKLRCDFNSGKKEPQ